ncbi:MAG: SDR family oxidoreductase [Asticcacaulis sp.]
MTKSAFIFGYGFIGKAFAEGARRQGFAIIATARTAEKRAELQASGITAIDPGDGQAMHEAAGADAILITPPPDDNGCPAFAAIGGLVHPGQWIGYLSTTGVYGDRGGGWVFEDSTLRPSSTEGRRRVTAENQWLTNGAHLFRLPGLYGPGRSIIDRLRDGAARRVHIPGHVFSRLHHDDCATALMASLARPNPGRSYNLCDDKPAPAEEVLIFAARLMGADLPGETAFDDLPPPARRFYADNKRVSNARAKAELGWRPLYPTYAEGLRAIWAAIQAGKIG